ncbi:signal peptide peptidase SppA [Parazoarcus communis]|uniref:Signal peptide peptidase SppA n=2 Tax=Parazoarcus communis TaxID=41977 RepID=A0A2U8H0W2_9RHOO|nr:signal peptide peptidase SppA [Parazoarcus communis]
MIGGMFRFLGRVLRTLWRSLDLLRRTVFNLLLLVLLGALLMTFFHPEPQVPDGAALVLRPSGALVEQTTFEEPLALLSMRGEDGGQTVLHDLLEVVRAARNDSRISALVLETDDLEAASLSKLAELRAAIADFKATGRPVLARGERFTQGQYYLASIADEVQLAPDGFVLLRGLSRYSTYFRGALDALGIKVHVFRVGEYKSFSEPFTRSDMSDEDRSATRDLLDGLWAHFRTDVAAARKLAPEALDGYIVGYRDALAATAGDTAEAARRAGLIDRFSTPDEWRDQLAERFGTDASGKDFHQIDAGAYLAVVRGAEKSAADKIAVLVAQGAIADGEQPPGVVGGDTFARMIREAREDDAIKALVVRIDSPGGSAWASEQIRRELELTRKAGKPVIASMSSVAASGGYWIAAGADEIWAAPGTVTGSIGVFAMFPEFAEPLRRLGITVDGVATAPLAGALDPRRPLDPVAAEAMQLGIEHGYRRFLQVVAAARNMKEDEVNQVARGRVWTGQAAFELGLVDQLGGIEAAIAAAAQRAGLERHSLVWPSVGLTPAQMVMQRFLSFSGLAGSGSPASSGPVAQMLNRLQAETRDLLRWNDPQHVYAHCLCEAP